MFRSARIQLTALYLSIIMLITILFSVAIYQYLSADEERDLIRQQMNVYREQSQYWPIPLDLSQITLDQTVINEARNRIRVFLIIVDGVIFLIAGGTGYFLSGLTLSPIEKMVEEQNRFVADASHELKTPLTSLRTAIEVHLRDQHATKASTKKLLEENLEEVDSLQHLSNALLRLASYDSTNDEQQSTFVPLQRVIEKAIKTLSPLANQKQITIDFKHSSAVVSGDEISLTELFMILLDNAIKYSPPEKMITITEKRVDKTVSISISDQGIGIAAKDLPHIFDRFYRADFSRSKQKVQGYGLGLSIAKKILDLHHGTLTAKSSSDTGTTMTVRLPIA